MPGTLGYGCSVAEKILPDGNTDFSGGQNAAIDPNALKPNQYFIGVNVSTQKTSLTPRWSIVEKELDFSETGYFTRSTGLQVTYESIFYNGKFQAFIPYSIGPDYFNIYIVSGLIFLINLSDFSVRVLNGTDLLNVYSNRIHWSNAGQFLVIFDFPNNAFILDGINIRRADPADNEVPVSVMGTYNQSRLCIANAGIDWTAGDPAGSLATPDAPVTFTEINVASSPFVGDVYQLPTSNKNNDIITAIGFLQVLDKSTEIGPLLIATNNAVYSYRTDIPRSSWQGGTDSFVFGSVLLYSAGIVSQRAHQNVGGDFFFLSDDAQIRSMTMARDAQYRWSNAPISREVENFLKPFDETLLQYSVMSYYNNKIFTTCNPYRVHCTSAEGFSQFDYVFSGVTVLELDHIAGIGEKTEPAWAGVWTGIRFMDFSKNNKQLYIAGKDTAGRNKMYVFDPSKTYDIIDGKVRLVRSVVVTKEYNNTDQTVNKAIHSVDLGLREMQEKVDVNVTYKTSTSQTYNYWRDLSFDAPVEQCTSMPLFPQGLQSQGVRDLNLGGVDETTCDISDDNLMHVYKGVQLRLIITGKYWELEYLKLKSLLLDQNELIDSCDVKKGEPVPAECFDIWEIPSMEEC